MQRQRIMSARRVAHITTCHFGIGHIEPAARSRAVPVNLSSASDGARRACAIAGHIIARVGSMAAPGKSFIDLDQTKKDKRLDHLMIFGVPAPGRDGPMHLCRPAQIFRECTIGQCLGQMQPADLFRAVEVGERARHAQYAVIAARGQLHGLGGVA